MSTNLNDITFSDIISDESSTLTIEFSGPIPTGTNLNTSVTIDPPYIAYLFGNITTSDGGTTWTGTIKRTPYMNRLSNTITVSYSGVTINKIFDVLESADLKQSEWSEYNNVTTSNDIYNIALSGNGNVFVISTDNVLRVYENTGSWTQKGDDVDVSTTVSIARKISISQDGNIIAVSNPYYNNSRGRVTIYEYNSTTGWTQKGTNSINGTNDNELLGISISLSSNGLIIAVGVQGYESPGQVQVYEFLSNNWQQKGSFINGASTNDYFGSSVSISNDGLIVAVGAKHESKKGYTYIYEYTGEWTPVGEPIVGQNDWDYFGYSTSISGNGTRIAIGANNNHTNGYASGQVRIYDYNGTSWTQVGNSINGENAGDNCGENLALSKDGNIITVGSPYESSNQTNNGKLRIFQYNSSLNTWEEIGSFIENLSNSYVGRNIAISDDGSKVAYGITTSVGGQSKAFNLNTYIERQVSAIEFPDEITDTNATDFEVKFTTNDKAFTDISGFMSVYPDNGTLVVSNLSNNGFSMVGTFTANNDVDETNNTLSYNEPNVLGNVLGEKTFSIDTITLIDEGVTFSDIIGNESSTLTIVFQIPIPTGTNLNTSVTIDPPYIAYLFGDITTSDGGTTWTGTIKRTPYMNRLSNTISVSYSDITVNKTFDVLESVENSQLINKKWSLTNSDTINNVFTSTLQMSLNGLLMGFINGANVEIYRKSENWILDVSFVGHKFALTNNHIVLANDASLQIYDYSGNSWNIMNGGNLAYLNINALTINVDGTYVAVSDNSDVKVYKFINNQNWIYYSLFSNGNVKGLSLSPNGLKLGMGIGNTGEDFSSIVVENVVDNIPPVITLIGDVSLTIGLGTTWNEPGYTAIDNIDGDISNNVAIIGSVNSDVSGVYTLQYDVSDNAGNVALQVTRIVTVINIQTYTLRWTNSEQDIFQMLGLYNKLSVQTQSTRMTAVVDDVNEYINGNYVLECNGYMNNYHYYKSFWSTDGEYVGIFNYVTINHHLYGGITGNTNPYDNTGNYQGYGTTTEGTLFHSQLSSDTNTYSGEYMLLEFPLYFEIHSFYMSSAASQNYYIFEDFVLLGSNDLTTYDTIFVHNGTPNTVTNVTIDLSSNTAKYKYFKIIFTKGNRHDPHIEHIKWYGDFYTMDTTPDTTPPVITLTGNATVDHEINTTYNDAGATANDAMEGDLTNNIVTVNNVNIAVLGPYNVTYNVADSKGNNAVEVVRLVNIVDTTNPVVTLNGDAEVTLNVGDTYTELGATATDNSLESLTVDISGQTVDTNTIGDYIVTYTATDSTGNSHQIERLVHIIAPTPSYTLRWTSDPATNLFDLLSNNLYNGITATNENTYDVIISGQTDSYLNGTYNFEYSGHASTTYNIKHALIYDGEYRSINGIYLDTPNILPVYGSQTGKYNRTQYDFSTTLYRGFTNNASSTYVNFTQTATNSNDYRGDYIEFTFPFKVKPIKIEWDARDEQYSPNEFVVLGSNDKISYDYLEVGNGKATVITCNISTVNKYSTFKVIVTKYNSYNYVCRQIKIYGDIYA